MPTAAPQALSAAQAARFREALRLLQAGRTGDAQAIAEGLVASAARAPDAQQLLAMCLAHAADYGRAARTFQRALDLAPGQPMLLRNYATMLRSQAGAAREAGDLAVARDAYARALELEPRHPGTVLDLGMVLRECGRPDQAVVRLQRARDEGDASPELADALVGALLDEGRREEALRLAADVAARHPDFVPGLVTLAHLRWEYAAADGEDAFEPLRAAIRRRPHDGTLRVALARLLLAVREPAEALEQVRWLRAQEDHPMLAAMHAAALDLLGEGDRAGALYAQLQREWREAGPEFINAHVRHLLKAGQWDAAARRAADAIGLDRRNQEAWGYLGTAWRLLGDPREDWLCDYERLVGMVEVEPPDGHADQAGFLQALAASLEPLHTAHREPLQQSLRGGSQTPGRLFGRSDPVLDATRDALVRAVDRWIATLPADDGHPFLARKARSVRIGGSWSVRLWSSGRHANHVHPQGWMSSAFYVSLPPSVTASAGGQAGHIQFGQPPAELGLALAPRRVLAPRPGMLALFPSYMWHGTIPFEDESPRLTVAFDMTPLAGDAMRAGAAGE